MENTAIIVLGAPNDDRGVLSSLARERCEQALLEFQRYPEARLIPTGGWGQHFNMTAQPHGYYLREYLKGRGVPTEVITECIESANTIEDARLCRPVVERHGFRKLIVVTSDFHVARARFLFKREFPALALEFSGATTHLPDAELQQRIAHERNALARLTENSGA